MASAPSPVELTILVVEDDALLAADLEETIRRCGHRCLGPSGSLSEVLQLLETNRVDAAILDVRLRHGERAYPAADLLAARGTPFAFVTAYGAGHIDPRYAQCRILPKPVLREEVELLVQELIGRPQPVRPQELTAATPDRL